LLGNKEGNSLGIIDGMELGLTDGSLCFNALDNKLGIIDGVDDGMALCSTDESLLALSVGCVLGMRLVVIDSVMLGIIE